MEDAKDPDEYVVKYGSGRFKALVNQAISLVEFKVKVTKKDFDLNNTNDKIKFLNEIAKLISAEENNIEREIYIEKISKEYNISKEALYAQINKLSLPKNVSSKLLEKTTEMKAKNNESISIDKAVIQRERMIVSLILNNKENVYKELKKHVTVDDFKDKNTKQIIARVYEEYEKGNINTSSIMNVLDEEEQNYIAGIIAEDYEITNLEKTIKTISQIYEKEKLLTEQRNTIEKLGQSGLTEEEKNELGLKLKEIIGKLGDK
jgi:DNA primase